MLACIKSNSRLGILLSGAWFMIYDILYLLCQILIRVINAFSSLQVTQEHRMMSGQRERKQRPPKERSAKEIAAVGALYFYEHVYSANAVFSHQSDRKFVRKTNIRSQERNRYFEGRSRPEKGGIPKNAAKSGDNHQSVIAICCLANRFEGLSDTMWSRHRATSFYNQWHPSLHWLVLLLVSVREVWVYVFLYSWIHLLGGRRNSIERLCKAPG